MINVIKKTLISGNQIMAEIFVDELSEILGIKNIDGYELFQGSITYVIKSGEFFIMDSEGIWRKTNGEAIS